MFFAEFLIFFCIPNKGLKLVFGSSKSKVLRTGQICFQLTDKRTKIIFLWFHIHDKAQSFYS